MGKDKRTFFTRYWWVFAGAIAGIALSSALNLTNTDGWIVITNSSNESFNINWNTTRPTVCSSGNYSYWSGTGFLCRDDTTGGSSGGDGTGGWTNNTTSTYTTLRVGVNNTNPAFALDVRGNVRIAPEGSGVIVLNDASNASGFWGINGGMVGTGGYNNIVSQSRGHRFYTGSTLNTMTLGTLRAAINSTNGYFSINITDPRSLLHVGGNATIDGNIYSTQICLNSDCRSVWPLDTYANVTNLQAVFNYSLDRPSVLGNISSLNATKAGTGAVNCGSGTLLQNLTLSSTGVSGQCYTDQTGGGGVSDGNKGDITVASSGAAWYLNNATVGINKFTATGTPSATTFLRGDNTWATPSATGSTSWTNWTSARVNSTSNTVWTSIPNLTTTLSASLNYSVDCVFLSYTNLVTTGEQIRVNFTGTIPVNVTLVYNSQVSATTRTSYGGRNTTADNVFADTGSAGTNLLDIVELTGRVRTGTSAATINYALKSEIAGNNSVIEEGSRCTYGVLS